MHSHLPCGTYLVAITAALTLSATQLVAQYTSDFEALPATPNGVDLWDPLQPAGTPGADNYYWPAGTTSVPFQAFTYAGSSVPANPLGGANYIAGTGPASPTFARAQRNMGFGCNAGPWTYAFDVLVQYNAALPAGQNIGSFSAQPFPGGQTFIMLARWTDPTTAANWNADYVWYDAAGAQITESVADPGFQNLAVNQWYRWETDVNLSSNRVVEVRITDLTTFTTVVNNPVGRYLEGGTAGAAPPTGFRFFAGGTTIGNLMAFDNPSVMPGKIIPIAGCTNPPGSLVARGGPRLGDILFFDIDAPAGIVTPGASLPILALSLSPDPTLPCGTTIPGITGGLLIGAPPGALLISGVPWAGPGTPSTLGFVLPPATPANCVFVNFSVFAQGLLLDGVTGAVMLTQGAQVIVGG